jgi:hypothetical protein
MNLIKKFILTALLKNISEALFRKRTRNIVKAQLDHAVPGLNPPPDDGKTVVDQLDQAYELRESLNEQQLQNSEVINTLKKKLNDMIVDDWMPTVQKFCAGDVGVAKSYGFGVKGEYDAESDPPVTVKTSYPSIVNVITGVHLQLTIEVENNVNKEIILPPDAKGIDVYEFIGNDLPEGDYRKVMQYCGRATRGKCTVHFDESQVGKSVWLLAAYVAKNKADQNQLCSKQKLMIV